MKSKRIKGFLFVILAIYLAVALGLSVYFFSETAKRGSGALPSSERELVRLYGNNQQLEPVRFDNLAPGDEVSKTYRLTSASGEDCWFILRAGACSGDAEHYVATVLWDGEELFSGGMEELLAAPLPERALAAGASCELKLTFGMSTEVGNEAQGSGFEFCLVVDSANRRGGQRRR